MWSTSWTSVRLTSPLRKSELIVILISAIIFQPFIVSFSCRFDFIHSSTMASEKALTLLRARLCNPSFVYGAFKSSKDSNYRYNPYFFFRFGIFYSSGHDLVDFKDSFFFLFSDKNDVYSFEKVMQVANSYTDQSFSHLDWFDIVDVRILLLYSFSFFV